MTWRDDDAEEERRSKEYEENVRERREQIAEWLVQKAQEADRKRRRETDAQVESLRVTTIKRDSLAVSVTLDRADRLKLQKQCQPRITIVFGSWRFPARISDASVPIVSTWTGPVAIRGQLILDQSGDLVLEGARFEPLPLPESEEKTPEDERRDWEEKLREMLK